MYHFARSLWLRPIVYDGVFLDVDRHLCFNSVFSCTTWDCGATNVTQLVFQMD